MQGPDTTVCYCGRAVPGSLPRRRHLPVQVWMRLTIFWPLCWPQALGEAQGRVCKQQQRQQHRAKYRMLRTLHVMIIALTCSGVVVCALVPIGVSVLLLLAGICTAQRAPSRMSSTAPTPSTPWAMQPLHVCRASSPKQGQCSRAVIGAIGPRRMTWATGAGVTLTAAT